MTTPQPDVALTHSLVTGAAKEITGTILMMLEVPGGWIYVMEHRYTSRKCKRELYHETLPLVREIPH